MCGRLGALVVFLAARVQEIMWIMEHVHDLNAWPSVGTMSLVGWRVEMAAHVFTCVDPSRTAVLGSLNYHISTLITGTSSSHVVSGISVVRKGGCINLLRIA